MHDKISWFVLDNLENGAKSLAMLGKWGRSPHWGRSKKSCNAWQTGEKITAHHGYQKDITLQILWSWVWHSRIQNIPELDVVEISCGSRPDENAISWHRSKEKILKISIFSLSFSRKDSSHRQGMLEMSNCTPVHRTTRHLYSFTAYKENPFPRKDHERTLLYTGLWLARDCKRRVWISDLSGAVSAHQCCDHFAHTSTNALLFPLSLLSLALPCQESSLTSPLGQCHEQITPVLTW